MHSVTNSNSATSTYSPISLWCSSEHARPHRDFEGQGFIRCRIVNTSDKRVLVTAYTSGGTAFTGNAGPRYINSKVTDHFACTVYERPPSRTGDYAQVICDQEWIRPGKTKIFTIPVFWHYAREERTVIVNAMISSPEVQAVEFEAVLKPVTQEQAVLTAKYYRELEWRRESVRHARSVVCNAYDSIREARVEMLRDARLVGADKVTATKAGRDLLTRALIAMDRVAHETCRPNAGQK